MMATGAQEGVIGIKAKKKKAVEAIEVACRGTRVRVQWLGDFYPAGDEYDLVYTVTGKRIPRVKQAAIGNSACDQCRYCTEFCPRFLLGDQVEPHPGMRTLAFTGTGAERFNEWAALCCSCGLCTLSACPGEIYPKEACDDSKAALRKQDFNWTGKTDIKVHPMRDGRRVSIRTLMEKMHVEQYDSPAPLRSGIVETRTLVLPLKQSAADQPVSEPAPNALGAIIHAPFASKVTAIASERITLTKS